MSDSGNTKDKLAKPERPKPKPLQMVAVDHDYIKHSQTGGTTMENKPRDK